jgi:hypothetical protein
MDKTMNWRRLTWVILPPDSLESHSLSLSLPDKACQIEALGCIVCKGYDDLFVVMFVFSFFLQPLLCWTEIA